jgi:hypothetical protein
MVRILFVNIPLKKGKSLSSQNPKNPNSNLYPTHNTHKNQIARMTSLPTGEGILHHNISRPWRVAFNEQKHFFGRSFQVLI